MAELFLQDLHPTTIARPPEHFGYDFLVSFSNRSGGINTFGVEVKLTTRDDPSSFEVNRRMYDRLAHSNIPGLLLVVNVKENSFFFGWATRADTRYSASGPISIRLTRINDKVKSELHKKLTA
jgi:hypothetical protein